MRVDLPVNILIRRYSCKQFLGLRWDSMDLAVNKDYVNVSRFTYIYYICTI